MARVAATADTLLVSVRDVEKGSGQNSTSPSSMVKKVT
jgi:hypothetical protein